MATPSDNSVRYDIMIEAKAALESLREMMRLSQSNEEKIMEFSQVLLSQSKAWGVSWMEALSAYKLLNAELSKQHQATIFGNTGGQNLFDKVEQYVPTLIKAERATDGVTESTKKMGDEIEKTSNRAIRAIDPIRIALGAIVAMLVFNVIQAFSNAFHSATENAKELESTLYRLANTERILSEEGISISLKGIEDGITRIKKLLPIFSREDISGLVGQLAIALKDLHLTEQQIIDLSQAVAIYNVNSAKNETLMETGQAVISSLLTNNAKGVANVFTAIDQILNTEEVPS